MTIRVLGISFFCTVSILAFGQASKPPDASTKPPDASNGPVPRAVEQMPRRFQPPVPGCTDCFYTVPSGNVMGAMGTTNNEGVKVTKPAPSTSPAPPAAPAHALSSTAYTDLVFKSGNGAWPVRSPSPVPLFIGSTVGLSRTATAAFSLPSACSLQSIDYTTQAGIITTLSIPLSLWDVTTKTKLADLPTNWNSWKPVAYPPVSVGKQIPAGHKLQVRLTQPAYSALPANFQFTINVAAHCLKGNISKPPETAPRPAAPPTAPQQKKPAPHVKKPN